MGVDLSDTLSRTSISQINAYGLVAFLAFGMMCHSVAAVSTSLLWRSVWYQKIREKMGSYGAWALSSWFQGFGWMAFQVCLSVSAFLYVERFITVPGVGHPGDFSWVFGWYLAAMLSAYLVPIMIASVRSFIPALIVLIAMEVSLLFAFAYLFLYRNSSYQHLTTGSPAPWVLIWPVAWGFWSICNVVAIMAYGDSIYRNDYDQIVEDKGTYSEAIARQNNPGGYNAGNPNDILAQSVLTNTATVARGGGASNATAAFQRTSSVSPIGTATLQEHMHMGLNSINAGSELTGNFGSNTATRHSNMNTKTSAYSY